MPKHIFLTFKAHLIFWLVYYVFCYWMDQLVDESMTWDIVLLFLLSNNIFLFYSLSYCLNASSVKGFKGIATTAFRFAVAIMIFLVVRYSVRYWFMANYIRHDLGKLDLREWFTTATVWVINYMFYASAYYFFKTSLVKQNKINVFRQEKLEQEKKNLQKEKDFLAMENRLLRTQINPHVLYNTLNFLYAKSLPVSEELSNGILTLSEIMQYSLRNQESNGLVKLSEEIEHIENVIAIARLKSADKTFLDVHISDFDPATSVLPLLLLTVVENIFKHGDVSDPSRPGTISITIEPDERIRFFASNRPRKAKEMPGTNLGLGNARTRMQREYGEDANMQITQNEDLFQIEISLPIRHHKQKQTKMIA